MQSAMLRSNAGRLTPWTKGENDYELYGEPQRIEPFYDVYCEECKLERRYYKARLPKWLKATLETGE